MIDKTRYLSHRECMALGLIPYAVYGGKVYSFKVTPDRHATPHGDERYTKAVRDADDLLKRFPV